MIFERLFSSGSVVIYQFLFILSIIGRTVLQNVPKWDFSIIVHYYGSSQLAVTLSDIAASIMWSLVCILLLIYLVHIKRFCEPRPVTCGTVLLKLLWMIIERAFQTTVFLLQFLLAFTIILRTVLLKNPEWDFIISNDYYTESVRLSQAAIAVIWVLICVLSLISIIHMGYIILYYKPKPVSWKLIFITLLWMIPMLIGTFAYFVTINWYVWLSWTSNLDSRNQFYQVFPATFLLVHGLVQIIFIRHLDYYIESFICLSNVSFNVVMLIHLCTCCVDCLETSVNASDPILSTAITATLPFEVTHRGMALVVFIVSLLSRRCDPPTFLTTHQHIVEERGENVYNVFVINQSLLNRSFTFSPNIQSLNTDCPISSDTQVNPATNVTLVNRYQFVVPHPTHHPPEIGRDVACQISKEDNHDDTPSYSMAAQTSARQAGPEGGGACCIGKGRSTLPQGQSLREELVT